MISLSNPVGDGHVPNRHADVVAVQRLLNLHAGHLHMPLLKEDGVCGARTIGAIKEFQKRVVKLARPDGRVDPGGRTLAALSHGPKHGGAAVAAPTFITLTGEKLPAPAERVLTEILRAAGLARAQVTSVTRTAHEQAVVMYDNIIALGAAYSYKLYGPNGDHVTKVYADNKAKSRADIIKLMEAKINALGPDNVSKHCSNTRHTFDVAPSSIANKPAFVTAVAAHKSVLRFLKPPDDPAYHIEISR
jgi:hypothetical protein